MFLEKNLVDMTDEELDVAFKELWEKIKSGISTKELREKLKGEE